MGYALKNDRNRFKAYSRAGAGRADLAV